MKHANTPEDVSYELTFRSFKDAELMVEADLTSPLLNSTLCPDGKVRVKMQVTSMTLKPTPRFPIDSFQVASLVEFLKMQSVVLETLEAELPGDRANWQTKKKKPAAAEPNLSILKRVKFSYLDIRPKKVPTEKFIERMKNLMSAEGLANVLAGEDTPQTRNYFRVVLDVPWDREHEVQFRFRDGSFTSLAHE